MIQNFDRVGGETMSKEVIAGIEEAEARAKAIRDEASAKAAEMIRDSEKKARSDYDDAERRMNSEIKETLDKIRKKSDLLIENGKKEASPDIRKLEDSAKLYSGEAVKTVTRGMLAKCQ